MLSRTVAFLMAAAMLAGPVLAADETAERLDTAAAAFEEIMGTADKAIPLDLLRKAHCLVLVPGLKKGAFIVGAKYGRGFIVCRQDGGWSAPAGVRVEGGSIGFQIGGSETDVVMAVMNQRGVDRLLSSQFTLGGDASVAAGPVGRTATAQTDAKMTAEILSWSRSRGVFAGVSLQGATLRQDDEANRDMYGRVLSNREIVKGGTRPPQSAGRLLDLLGRY
jgi:lipid-binding SYLF domain-containing protein